MTMVQGALFGVDHERLDEISIERVGDSACIALSPGAHGWSPGALSKVDPNEDGVAAIDDGARVLAAVADAHFGSGASTTWMDRILDLESIPGERIELSDALIRIAEEDLVEESRSRTALCIAIVDADAGRCYGLARGDADALHLVRGDDAWECRSLVDPEEDWIGVSGYEIAGARFFAEDVEPGDRIVLATDGLRECCYGKPDRSVTSEDIAEVQARHASRFGLFGFVLELAQLALTGVRGQPGGQDNVAIAAVDVLASRITSLDRTE